MKVVIAGSASLENEIQTWVKYWNNQESCSVLNYSQAIPVNQFEKLYPEIHNNFFKDIDKADILFIANEEKKGINGYIGAETFAELSFGLAKKLIEGKDIKLILAHMPDKEVNCYDEILLWNKLGWIDRIME